MKRIMLFAGLFFLFVALCVGCASPSATPEVALQSEDMFQALLGKSKEEVQAKIDAAWQHLFYGDDKRERIYYEAVSYTHLTLPTKRIV